MKKTLTALLVVAVVFAAYFLLYMYAYRNLDANHMGSHPLRPVGEAAQREIEQRKSTLDKFLGPIARAHQSRKQSQAARHLEGVWVLSDPAEFGSLVPATLEFTHESGSRVSCFPAIKSGEDRLETFEVTQWLKPEYPTGLFTGSSINFSLLSDDCIGVQTSEMDVF